MFKVCDICGASLDPQESCECKKAPDERQLNQGAQTIKSPNYNIDFSEAQSPAELLRMMHTDMLCTICGEQIAENTTVYRKGNKIIGCEYCIEAVKAQRIVEEVSGWQN